MQAWLQAFCWTEREHPKQLAARAGPVESAAAPASLSEEPMFCFETALKALYFSFLVSSLEGCIQAGSFVTCRESVTDNADCRRMSTKSLVYLLLMWRLTWKPAMHWR